MYVVLSLCHHHNKERREETTHEKTQSQQNPTRMHDHVHVCTCARTRGGGPNTTHAEHAGTRYNILPKGVETEKIKRSGERGGGNGKLPVLQDFFDSRYLCSFLSG